jgi:hypothetical protein
MTPTPQAASPTQTLESGTFYGVLHPTEGRATIARKADRARVLRFTNFKTSNGPDVHVSLVAAGDAKDSASVLHAGFIDVGSMKGNIGGQNYALGPEADLSNYRAVSIWCKRFSVNFGTAPWMPGQAALQNQHIEKAFGLAVIDRHCRRPIATASLC